MNILREEASTSSPMPHQYTHIQIGPQVSHPQASYVIAAPLPVPNEHCHVLIDETPREEQATLAVVPAAAANPSHHPAGSTHLLLLQVAAAQPRLLFVSPKHHRSHSKLPPLAKQQVILCRRQTGKQQVSARHAPLLSQCRDS